MALLKKPLALILFILPLAAIICLMGFILGEVEKTLKKDLAIRLKTNLAAVEKAVNIWANEEKTRQTIMGLVDMASKGPMYPEILLKSDYSDLKLKFLPIFETVQYGESGETYAFLANGKMITESRFDPMLKALGLIQKQSMLEMTVRDPGGNLLEGFQPRVPREKQPLTRMARSAASGERGFDVDGYRDYRGVPVVGAWAWLPEYGFGIASEIDVAEAHSAIFTLTRLFQGLCALIILLAAALFIVRSLMKRVKESETRTRSIFENVVDGIMSIDHSGIIQSFNPAAEHIFGYHASEAAGKNFQELLQKPSHEKYHDFFLNFPRAGNTGNNNKRREFLGRRKDGSTFLLEMAMQETRLDDKAMFTCILQNITERKRLEDELLKLSSAVKQSPVITFVTNTEGVIEYVNPKFTQVTGYAPEEAVGQNPRMLKSGKTPPETYKDLWDTVASGKEWRGELLNKKKNGELYWESASISPLRDHAGTITHYLGVKEDITERKRTEEALYQAKEEAENAASLKDQFVGLVAHDLKSPFVSILGFLKLIYQDHVNPLNPKHKEMIRRSLESGERLVNMVDELLKQCRFRAGKMALQYGFFDGHWIAASVLSDMARQAQEKGIHLRNEIPKGTRLYADPHLFKEVLVNLVSNSIKFCGAGNGITVFVPFGTDSAIAVKDTGLGIKADNLSKLFQPDMFTTTRGTKGEKGMGLGLVFCQEMIKAHGGKITAESVLGQGSTFYISLPVVKPKVLVVDDDSMSRQIIREFMSDANVEVGEAESGKMAMEMLKKFLPHLVVTDLCMPEIDGYKLIRHIRKDPKYASLPIIAITSDRELATREQVFRAGANDFVTKPLMMDEFNPRVKRYVGYGIAA